MKTANYRPRPALAMEPQCGIILIQIGRAGILGSGDLFAELAFFALLASGLVSLPWRRSPRASLRPIPRPHPQMARPAGRDC